jgi:predicted MPP superfamily phosphohydrolase
MWLSPEFRPALLFAAVVVAIFVAAGGTVVRQAASLAAGRPLQPLSLPRKGVLVLAGVGVVCVLYGRFVEPYWPDIVHVRLSSPKLSAASRPIRIVQISDLHSDPTPRLEPRLPDLIAAQKPDLVVFTGDAINAPGGLQVFRSCLQRVAAVAPTYVVRGNWDAWFWPKLDLFGGTGAVAVNGAPVRVSVAGVELWVSGVDVESEHRIPQSLAGIPAGAYVVFLHHYPDEIAAVAAHKVDLYCAGHTHGGQIALPFYGALVTLSRFGKRYEGGLYRVADTTLYVNRGMCARPELTVFELTGR